MSNVRSSLAFSAVNSYLGLVLQLISTAIISRILNPHEIGVFSVAAVLAALASTFRDFGVAEYLIQKKDITDDDIRASFTVNLAASWLVGLLLYVSAPLVSDFYREPGVGQVMHVQAISFALIPFGAVTLAWHRRMMSFKPIMWAGIAGSIASFVVGISLAMAGFSYMSLAWSSLAGVVATIIVAILSRPVGFPRLPGIRAVAAAFHFGKFASSAFMAAQIGKGAPDLIIGKVAGLSTLGIFSRANGMVEILNIIILKAASPVCLPYFSEAIRTEGIISPSLTRTITMATAIGWPLLAFLGIFSHSVIYILYGPAWMDSVPYARLVCIIASIDLVYQFANHAFFASGLAKTANHRTLIVQGIRITLLLCASYFGMSFLMLALALSSIVNLFTTQFLLQKHANVKWQSVLEAIKPSATLTMFSAIPALGVLLISDSLDINYLGEGVLGAALVVVVWVYSAKRLNHPIYGEMTRAWKASRADRAP